MPNIKNIIRDRINTPLGTVVIVSGTIFTTELLFMLFIEDLLHGKFGIAPAVIGIIDSVMVIIIAIPILYQRILVGENKLKKISESTQDAIIMMDSDGLISFWNNASEQMFGYTATEAIGKKLHSLLVPSQKLPAFEHSFPAFQRTGKGPIIGKIREEYAKRKNGTTFPVELSISSTQIGGKWNAIGIVHDITERKRSEEATGKKEKSLSEAQRIAHFGSWELDIKNNALTWSDENYRIFETTKSESTASYEAFLGMIHPDDRDYVNKAYSESVRNHTPYNIEHRLVMNDGRVKFVSERCETFYDQNGEPVRSIGTTYDITAQKNAEINLRKRDEELVQINLSLTAAKNEIERAKTLDEALIASLGEGMIAIDKFGKLLVVNKKAEEISGYEKADVLGKSMIEVFNVVDQSGKAVSPEKRPGSIVLETMKPSASDALYLVHKNGGTTPISVIATPAILDNELLGAVITFRDISKEKEIEKTREDLLALASHQLRTPLSGTKWLIETLQSGIKGAINLGQKEYLDEIYKINQRMIALVSDMLGVLRIESSTILVKKGMVSATEVLGTMLETFIPVAKGKQLTIRIEKDGEYAIETDAVLLRNILDSLVSNAVNYSNAGGEVVVYVNKEHDGLIIAVKDSGIGIPKDEQVRLFERFYRASNAKTFNTRGTGLGLYIAATLAEKIGARLSFESDEGNGSTFFIHLPENTTSV